MENPMNKWMIWGENPLFSGTSIWSHGYPMGKCNDKILLEGPVDGASGVTGILR